MEKMIEQQKSEGLENVLETIESEIKHLKIS